MDSIPAVASYSTAASQERVGTEVGLRVLKMANDNEKLVAALMLKTLQAVTTGTGRNIDVMA